MSAFAKIRRNVSEENAYLAPANVEIKALQGDRKPSRTLDIFVRRNAPRPSPVFDTYWKFAAERQFIFHARVSGASSPWTGDSILREFKFTNAYRASDRVSQYLIKNVIYNGEYNWPSTLLRILLFKIFNKISTWELIESQIGSISVESFSSKKIGQILDSALANGASIYSGAYIMPSGPKAVRQTRKHMMHLALLSAISSGKFGNELSVARSMSDAYNLLLDTPSFWTLSRLSISYRSQLQPVLKFFRDGFCHAGTRGARWHSEMFLQFR